MERVAFRPVRQASAATLLITSFALSFLLQNVAALIWGSLPRTTDFASGLSSSFTIGSIAIQKLDVVIVGVTLVLLAAVGLFFRRTTLGTQMRAAAEDFQHGARARDPRQHGDRGGVRALRRCSPRRRRSCSRPRPARSSPTIGVNIVLFAFIATIVGGMGSLPRRGARRLLDRRPDGRAAGVAPARASGPTATRSCSPPCSLCWSSGRRGSCPRGRPSRERSRAATDLRDVPGDSDAWAPATAAAPSERARARRRPPASDPHETVSGRWLALMALTCSVALVRLGSRAGLARPGRARDGDQPVRRRRPLHVRRRLGRLLVRARGVHGDRRVRRRDPRHPARDEGVRAPRPARLPGPRAPRRRFLPTIAAGGIAAARRACSRRSARPPLGSDSGARDVCRSHHRERRRAELAAGDARDRRRGRDPHRRRRSGERSAGRWSRWPPRGLFQRSRVGLRLRASREDEAAARAIGVGVARERTIAFVLSAFFVGVAGALFGMFIGSFNPDAFFLNITFLMVVMLVIGGMTSLAGAVRRDDRDLRRLRAPAAGRGRGRPRARSSSRRSPGLREVGLALVMLAILILRPERTDRRPRARRGRSARRGSRAIASFRPHVQGWRLDATRSAREVMLRAVGASARRLLAVGCERLRSAAAATARQDGEADRDRHGEQPHRRPRPVRARDQRRHGRRGGRHQRRRRRRRPARSRSSTSTRSRISTCRRPPRSR